MDNAPSARREEMQPKEPLRLPKDEPFKTGDGTLIVMVITIIVLISAGMISTLM
jgi:hypothetical protein